MEISVAVDQPYRPARPGQRIVLQSDSPPHVACPRAKQCETLSAVMPSSRPISSRILPSITFSTVMPREVHVTAGCRETSRLLDDPSEGLRLRRPCRSGSCLGIETLG